MTMKEQVVSTKQTESGLSGGRAACGRLRKTGPKLYPGGSVRALMYEAERPEGKDTVSRVKGEEVKHKVEPCRRTLGHFRCLRVLFL